MPPQNLQYSQFARQQVLDTQPEINFFHVLPKKQESLLP